MKNPSGKGEYMDRKEIVEALFDMRRVKHKGTLYRYVNALILRNVKGTAAYSAELMDLCGFSVVIVPIEEVENISRE